MTITNTQSYEISLLPIDVGFDVKFLNMKVNLPKTTGSITVHYRDKNSTVQKIIAPASAIRKTLKKSGYAV